MGHPADMIILDTTRAKDPPTTSGSARVPAIVNISHAIDAKACASAFEAYQHSCRTLLDHDENEISNQP